MWIGNMREGKLVLEAWQRELRIPEARVQQIAAGLAELFALKPEEWLPNPVDMLQWCKGFENEWDAPLARGVDGVTVVTVQGLRRFGDVIGKQPPFGSFSPMQEADRQHEAIDKELNARSSWADHLVVEFSQALATGRPARKPAKAPDAPYPARWNIVWITTSDEVASYISLDELRDALGLTQCREGDYVLVLSYALPSTSKTRVPTAIEGLGGWPWWPAKPGDAQRAMNYRTGVHGPREFVHAADEIPVGAARIQVKGRLARNWDDPPPASAA